jgi:hypothetical protein
MIVKMGVDLLNVRGHGSEGFNDAGWRAVLELAIEYGWQPEGTAPPDDNSGTWNGNYFSNDFQQVTDSDARTLAEALLRAVAALDARERERPTKWPDDWLSRVRSFAEFASKGGFLIG